ncbi:MAG: FRG domain-containing protein [Alphaproteobacteria bacterium]|nr:FRG domain-containing protein [Alphaproteobacteria bacterium]
MIINKNDIFNANLIVESDGKNLMSVDFFASMMKNHPISAVSHAISIHDLGVVVNNDKSGVALRTEENKFRIWLGGEFEPYIYRGQNKDYKFIPTIHRPADQNKLLISLVQREEFKNYFMALPYYKRLSNISIKGNTFDFDLEAVTQHYGFPTEYIDTTTNMNVALFFAYTYYDSGQYLPITDFDAYKPMLYIADYKTLLHETEPIIVGFQAVPRPLFQCAMAIKLPAKNNVKSLFRSIELPKDKDLAIGVYNSFKKGFDLFPNDYMSEIAEKINRLKIIHSGTIDEFCTQYNHSKNDILDLLRSKEFKLVDGNEYVFSDRILHDIHSEITNFILPWIQNNIGVRGTTPAIHEFMNKS